MNQNNFIKALGWTILFVMAFIAGVGLAGCLASPRISEIPTVTCDITIPLRGGQPFEVDLATCKGIDNVPEDQMKEECLSGGEYWMADCLNVYDPVVGISDYSIPSVCVDHVAVCDGPLIDELWGTSIDSSRASPSCHDVCPQVRENERIRGLR